MTGTASKGQLAAAISNAMVQIYSKHYGKGPTRAKTYLLDDVVVTVLQEIFTTVERTLIDAGKAETVRDVRTTFQYALRDEFTTAVQQVTGREVRAFLSQIDWHAEIAIEVFLLANGESDEAHSNDVPEVTEDGAGPT
jgi:uncharacterized protein YbcI